MATMTCPIQSIYDECRAPNWDGYDALPVTEAACSTAKAFVAALPADLTPTSYGVEADGCITIAWRKAPRRSLSISIGPDSLLHYACLNNNESHSGTMPLQKQTPIIIEHHIRAVLAEPQPEQIEGNP